MAVQKKEIEYAPWKDGGDHKFPVEDILLPYSECYNGNVLVKKAFAKTDLRQEHISEIIKCSDDPLYFIENYCRIISLDGGIVPFLLFDFQKEMIKMVTLNRYNLFTLGRQCGKTQIIAAYLTWFAIFHPTKTVAILANKGDAAQEIMDRVRLMIENLPFFIQPGVKIYNRRSIVLDTDAKIFSAATSSSSARGKSIDILYVDEAAFIEKDIEFYTSVYPTITSGKNTRVIMTSTPKGARGMFYMLWRDALDGKNTYKTLLADWSARPDRDQKWKDETIANIGYSRFRQEFECVGYDSLVTLQDNDFNFDISIGDAYKLLDDEPKFIVYDHTSPSGKSYIGKTKFTIRRRWKDHVSKSINSPTTIFHKALKKYSPSTWKHSVLRVCETEAESFLCEKEYISLRGENNIYNQTMGGEGGSGLVVVKDKEGLSFSVNINDPRYLSGELVPTATGTVKVRTKDGKVITIDKNNDKIGTEFILLYIGMKRTQEAKDNMSKAAKAGKTGHTKGYSHTEEWRMSHSEKTKGKPKIKNQKVTDEEVASIFIDYNNRVFVELEGVKLNKWCVPMSYHSAFCRFYGEKYNVTRTCIDNILKGSRALHYGK